MTANAGRTTVPGVLPDVSSGRQGRLPRRTFGDLARRLSRVATPSATTAHSTDGWDVHPLQLSLIQSVVFLQTTPVRLFLGRCGRRARRFRWRSAHPTERSFRYRSRPWLSDVWRGVMRPPWPTSWRALLAVLARRLLDPFRPSPRRPQTDAAPAAETPSATTARGASGDAAEAVVRRRRVRVAGHLGGAAPVAAVT